MWSIKYKPKKLDEFAGYGTLIESIKRYKWNKPLLLYGSSGVGKSALVEAIANEFNFDLVEINEENVDNSINIVKTKSLFGNNKLILIDNVDKLGVGDFRKITELVKETENPMILTTDDIKSKRLATIKDLCENLQIRKPHPATIVKYLEMISQKEGLKISKDILMEIAKNSNGDFRVAINDLETIAKEKKEIKQTDVEVLSSRDSSVEIYDALSLIFSGKDLEKAIESTQDLNQKPQDTLLWIDENVPFIYGNKLKEAYDNLSRADIFIGRITNRQYWGFLRYVNALMTAGISVARPEKITFARYRFPSYLIKMSKTKGKRSVEKSISEKLKPVLHNSNKIIAREYIPLFRTLIKNNKLKPEELKNEFGLTHDEIEFIANF